MGMLAVVVAAEAVVSPAVKLFVVSPGIRVVVWAAEGWDARICWPVVGVCKTFDGESPPFGATRVLPPSTA